MTRRSILFLSLTFAWSWVWFGAVALSSSAGLQLPFPGEIFLILAAFGPSIAAIILTAHFEATFGLRRLLKQVVSPALPAGVYVFVAVVPLTISGVAFIMTGGGSPIIEATLPLEFLVFFILGGSLGEELGWRGFLLPEFLRERSLLSATLLMAGVWAVWHLPLFYITGTSQYFTPFPVFIVLIIGLSVQYSWIFARSDGNLVACLLLHTFTNIVVRIFPYLTREDQTPRLLLEAGMNVLVAATLIVIYRKMFFARFQPASET